MEPTLQEKPNTVAANFYASCLPTASVAAVCGSTAVSITVTIVASLYTETTSTATSANELATALVVGTARVPYAVTVVITVI